MAVAKRTSSSGLPVELSYSRTSSRVVKYSRAPGEAESVVGGPLCGGRSLCVGWRGRRGAEECFEVGVPHEDPSRFSPVAPQARRRAPESTEKQIQFGDVYILFTLKYIPINKRRPEAPLC